MEKNVSVQNDSGIHARPAAMLVKVAAQFKSDINIEYQGKVINAKSIMNILSAGLQKGNEIKIVANGPDEEAALAAIVDLFNTKFGE
ncbi:HPr family phosphocarrier protein [Alkaliphilus crotonatoxidans]